MDKIYKNETPSKTPTNKIVNKIVTNHFNCDSPFRTLPNFSTPPSRFAKIRNPFDHHLIERLNLPTFSPSVFANVTNNESEKFKWTIDDISSFKPADIDEATIQQHVSDHDPIIESIVQEKINNFFNEKVVVPSPFNEEINRRPLIVESPETRMQSDEQTQTELSLPPILPKEVEKVLMPYFNRTDVNTSLYKKLFECDKINEVSNESVESSPPKSTGLSPLQLSPILAKNSSEEPYYSFDEISELKNCNISAISKSACKLNFSDHMSIDTNYSLIVPDINNQTNHPVHDNNNTLPSVEEFLSTSIINWDMENKKITSINYQTEHLIETNNTPHSKIFTSQRKRLSDSFKNKDNDEQMEDVEDNNDIIIKNKSKAQLFRNDITDAGYHTGGTTLLNEHSNGTHYLFASTPSKKNFN